MPDPFFTIIVGCGRLGSRLANQLSSDGHEVVVIDKDARTFDRLSVDFSGYKIVGDASEQSILQQANIQQANYFFACTSQDNMNLMVAQIASRIFNVPVVIARSYDPAREIIFQEFGIQTISPIQLTAEAFLATMQAEDA